jgi:hypothetical protein
MADDEWRVEVDLDDEEHGLSLGERLRALDLDDDARKRLGDRVVVTRDGSRILLYARSENDAREAERVVRELTRQDRVTADFASRGGIRSRRSGRTSASRCRTPRRTSRKKRRSASRSAQGCRTRVSSSWRPTSPSSCAT